MKKLLTLFSAAVVVFALPVFVHASGTVVEEIIARVNNDIITRSDYQKAEASLQPEAEQDCQGCTPDKINEMVAEEKKNLLRGLIDESLLVQRAKDMDISVETDVVKRLDAVRVLLRGCRSGRRSSVVAAVLQTVEKIVQRRLRRGAVAVVSVSVPS